MSHVNFPLNIDNCLYLEYFLKSIDIIQKSSIQKRLCTRKLCNNYIYMHSPFFMEFWQRNFEIWPENPRTNFAHILLLKDFYMADFCLIKKCLTNIQTKILASMGPRKNTKLIILKFRGIIYAPKKNGGRKLHFPGSYSRKIQRWSENSAKFHLNLHICESTKISIISIIIVYFVKASFAIWWITSKLNK